MNGTIFIINRATNIGKILLDGNQESRVMKFPSSFETGDIVKVQFYNNDINERIINISVLGNEWNYGFIIRPHIGRSGNILITYPKVKGLISYNKEQLKLSGNNNLQALSVKFKIKKTINGKVEAIDVTNVKKNEIYKCKSPIFGNLKKEVKQVQIGYIEDIVTTKKIDKNFVSGKILSIKKGVNNNFYGFIDTDQGNIYFNVNIFNKFYNRKPKKGDIVNFIINKYQNRIFVKEFCEPKKKEPLPSSKQYGIISIDNKKVRFLLSNYINFHKREVNKGDIVYFYTDKDKVIFRNDDLETVEQIILKKEKKRKFETGIVTHCNERGFGFIKSKKHDSVFFMLGNFKKIYGKEASKGSKVYFNIRKTEKGFSVSSFLDLNQKLICPKESFKNFIEIEKNSLYYAYTNDNKKAMEVYKFNPDNLSESISCYKDKNVTNKHKLEAIESLIKFNYSDTKIDQDKLKNDKIEILTELIEKEIATNNIQAALDYENKLQDIKFKPENLKKFNFLKSEYRIEFKADKKVKEIYSNEENWNLEFEKEIVFTNVDSENYFKIDLTENQREVTLVEDTEKWQIELNNSKEIKVINSDDELQIKID